MNKFLPVAIVMLMITAPAAATSHDNTNYKTGLVTANDKVAGLPVPFSYDMELALDNTMVNMGFADKGKVMEERADEAKQLVDAKCGNINSNATQKAMDACNNALKKVAKPMKNLQNMADKSDSREDTGLQTAKTKLSEIQTKLEGVQANLPENATDITQGVDNALTQINETTTSVDQADERPAPEEDGTTPGVPTDGSDTPTNVTDVAECEGLIHPACVGEWVIENGTCSWECKSSPLGGNPTNFGQ